MTGLHWLCVAPMMDWTDFIERDRGLVHRGTPRFEPTTPRFLASASHESFFAGRVVKFQRRLTQILILP